MAKKVGVRRDEGRKCEPKRKGRKERKKSEERKERGKESIEKEISRRVKREKWK